MLITIKNAKYKPKNKFKKKANSPLALDGRVVIGDDAEAVALVAGHVDPVAHQRHVGAEAVAEAGAGQLVCFPAGDIDTLLAYWLVAERRLELLVLMCVECRAGKCLLLTN